MKTLVRNLLIIAVLLLAGLNGYSQSCAITRVPSSASLPQSGGQTSTFSIILYGNCTPIFTVGSSTWLSYTYTPVDNTHGNLKIYGTANPGPPRTGYVYVDNKESLKITITQAGSYVYVNGITPVSPSSAFMLVNETKNLTASVLPANANNQSINWSSTNTTVAVVNIVNGVPVVTAKAPGKATINAVTAEGSYTSTCAITVSNKQRSFSWGGLITPAKNQLTQGPCFLFAAVGMVEDKYNIQNNYYTNINLAEGQLNIVCINQPEGIVPALNFITTTISNNWIYDEQCYPYSASIYGGGSGTLNCYTPCGSNYSMRAKITGYTSINFASIASNLRSDYLKNIIQTYGTVAVSFSGSNLLHGGAMHAYEVYGWNESQWLFKDSWPGAQGLYTTIADIPEILAAGNGLYNFAACYINGTVNVSLGGKSKEVDVPETDKVAYEPTIYPNPANNLITIANMPAEGAAIEIYNFAGASVLRGKVTDKVIDITSLSQGIYFVKLTYNTKSKVIKFIKK
jgi:hypothetical protein